MSDSPGRHGVGLAIFVKTPGRSPLKTRLAADVGRETADRFYDLSVAAVAAVAATAAEKGTVNGGGKIVPYWAVAENEGLADPRWGALPKIWQGDGDLADRLDRVYSQLLRSHRAAILIGSDMPQIPVHTIRKEAEASLNGTFQIIAAKDGGFVLFSGSRPIPLATWKAVPYSDAETRWRLHYAVAEIAGVGSVEWYETFRPTRSHEAFDVDDGESFRELARYEAGGLLPEQAVVIDFCRSRTA